LIIEADGGQHALPGADARRDATLIAQGWRILRFWNNDILTNRAGVLRTIAEALGTYPHPNPPPPAGEGASIGPAGPTVSEADSAFSAASAAPPPPSAGEGWGGG
jgi:hypothetical protein